METVAMGKKSQTDGSLVFHMGPLVQAVALWPVLGRLRATGEVVLVTNWELASLAQEFLGVNPVDIEQREFGRMLSRPGPSVLSPAVARLFETASRVISLVGDGEDAWSENLKRWSHHATVIHVDADPPIGWPGTIGRWYREGLKRNGIPATEHDGNRVTPRLVRTADEPGPVALSLDSARRSERGDQQRWVEGIREELLKRGREYICLPQSEADSGGDPSAAGMSAARSSSLAAIADTLIRCSACLGDCGEITHLAAALGLPTLVYVPVGTPRTHTPDGQRVRIVEGGHESAKPVQPLLDELDGLAG
ncbi:MAG: hypothetical protein JJU36_15280 [Phycisphaeraceae bacterium]|nr:hypothetical protein [Phycisphaeraceae bacterium]